MTGDRFLFMDDRSVVANAAEQLEADLEATNKFDAETGALENASQRQVWHRGEKKRIEHIGITAVPDDPEAVILPAAGWEKLEKCLKHVREVPGLRSTRRRLTMGYARPLWTWCAPVFSPLPEKLAKQVFRAVVKARCSWWCMYRFFAQNLELHPGFDMALTAFKRITEWEIQWSSFLETNFKKHCSMLGLRFLQHDEKRGVQFGRVPDERDLRVRKIFGRKAAIWSDEQEAQHVLRVVGRARLLSCVPLTRRDTEGIEQVDVDASGSKSYKDWRNSLNPNDRALLEIFRSGAASTPTRRQHGEAQAQDVCPCCGHPCKPSMRHFVVECPHFQQERRRAEEAHNMKPEVWAELPRVTTKSGWITFQAHPQKSRRGDFQAAVCQLAICILSDDSLKKTNPGRSMTADSRLSSQGQRFGLKFS